MKGIVGKERRNSQQFTAFVWVEENVKKCEICEKHEASIARAMQNDDDEEEKKIDNRNFTMIFPLQWLSFGSHFSQGREG